MQYMRQEVWGHKCVREIQKNHKVIQKKLQRNPKFHQKSKNSKDLKFSENLILLSKNPIFSSSKLRFLLWIYVVLDVFCCPTFIHLFFWKFFSGSMIPCWFPRYRHVRFLDGWTKWRGIGYSCSWISINLNNILGMFTNLYKFNSVFSQIMTPICLLCTLKECVNFWSKLTEEMDIYKSL